MAMTEISKDHGWCRELYGVDVAGRRQGPFTRWVHATGHKDLEVCYVDDRLEGPYVEYDRKGLVWLECDYKAGRLVRVVSKYHLGTNCVIGSHDAEAWMPGHGVTVRVRIPEGVGTITPLTSPQGCDSRAEAVVIVAITKNDTPSETGTLVWQDRTVRVGDLLRVPDFDPDPTAESGGIPVFRVREHCPKN